MPVKDYGNGVIEYSYERLKVSEKPLLSLDFDGVLHRYSRGYQDGTVYDGPTPGALEFVQEAQEHFILVVHSARARTVEGYEQIKDWLQLHGFPDLPVTPEKPPAFLHLDDRAVTFTGVFPAPAELMEFRHWTGARWGDRR